MASGATPALPGVAPHVWTVGLNVLGLIGLLYAGAGGQRPLSWALVALFLALAAHPVVAWLERRGLRRGLAVGLLVLTTLGLVAALLTTFVPMVLEQARALVEAGPGLLESLRHQALVGEAGRALRPL